MAGCAAAPRSLVLPSLSHTRTRRIARREPPPRAAWCLSSSAAAGSSTTTISCVPRERPTALAALVGADLTRLETTLASSSRPTGDDRAAVDCLRSMRCVSRRTSSSKWNAGDITRASSSGAGGLQPATFARLGPPSGTAITAYHSSMPCARASSRASPSPIRQPNPVEPLAHNHQPTNPATGSRRNAHRINCGAFPPACFRRPEQWRRSGSERCVRDEVLLLWRSWRWIEARAAEWPLRGSRARARTRRPAPAVAPLGLAARQQPKLQSAMRRCVTEGPPSPRSRAPPRAASGRPAPEDEQDPISRSPRQHVVVAAADLVTSSSGLKADEGAAGLIGRAPRCADDADAGESPSAASALVDFPSATGTDTHASVGSAA